MQLVISNDDLPAFMACLALGAIFATFEKNVNQGGGSLHTISTPKVTHPLLADQVLTEDLVHILMWVEDLLVMKEFYSEQQFESTLNEYINRLCIELSNGDPNRIWEINWIDKDSSS